MKRRRDSSGKLVRSEEGKILKSATAGGGCECCRDAEEPCVDVWFGFFYCFCGEATVEYIYLGRFCFGTEPQSETRDNDLVQIGESIPSYLIYSTVSAPCTAPGACEQPEEDPTPSVLLPDLTEEQEEILCSGCTVSPGQLLYQVSISQGNDGFEYDIKQDIVDPPESVCPRWKRDYFKNTRSCRSIIISAFNYETCQLETLYSHSYLSDITRVISESKNYRFFNDGIEDCCGENRITQDVIIQGTNCYDPSDSQYDITTVANSCGGLDSRGNYSYMNDINNVEIDGICGTSSAMKYTETGYETGYGEFTSTARCVYAPECP